MLHVFSNVFDRWGASLVEKRQGLMRRSCAHHSSVTMSFPRHLLVCLPGETCENCFCILERTRNLYEDRFDTLSIPNCVIKKGPTHGARHGNTEEQRIHHMAYNAWKRCRMKENDGMLDRFLNSPRYRASQVEHGWTEELCAKHDALAQNKTQKMKWRLAMRIATPQRDG